MLNKTLVIIYSILILLFFIFSAFFSSADMAFGSVSSLRLENYIKETNSKKAKTALRLCKNYDKTISTILFLNDLCNIGNETIAALLGYLIFSNIEGISSDLGIMIFSSSVLVLIIIFGEILPKALTKPNCFKFALFYAPLINVFVILFTPITFVMTRIGDFIIKTFKIKDKQNKIEHEELEEMVDAIEEEGLIDEDKGDLLRGAIDYSITEAYEIMTPRIDLYAIDIEDDKEEYLNNPETYVHSRIPVFDDTIDNIIGYVMVKDLIKAKLSNSDFQLKDYLIEPLKFPRSTEINDILVEFKRTKNHFALIMDEYGGIDGIITMEDIIEEIVGDIWDEADEKEEAIDETNDENTFIIDGSLNISDFFDFFDLDEDEIETNYVTIGGYCIELLDDRFAKVNDIIKFKNLEIKVLAIDENNTIEKLMVKKIVEE